MTTGSKLDVRRFDYGGSLAPVTMLQGVTECVCIFCMIILMVALRRFEKKVERCHGTYQIRPYQTNLERDLLVKAVHTIFNNSN